LPPYLEGRRDATVSNLVPLDQATVDMAVETFAGAATTTATAGALRSAENCREQLRKTFRKKRRDPDELVGIALFSFSLSILIDNAVLSVSQFFSSVLSVPAVAVDSVFIVTLSAAARSDTVKLPGALYAGHR